MKQHLLDSALAFTGGSATGTAVVATTPGVNPLIAQIVVPLVGAIVVPFLKDLSMLAITAIKRKMEAKKQNRKK